MAEARTGVNRHLGRDSDAKSEYLSHDSSSLRAARIQIMTASLGPAKAHTQAECEEMAKGHDRPEFNRRFIDYYVSEVVD